MDAHLNSIKSGLVLILLGLALACQAAVADVITVSPGESIQAAIDAASNGDEIEVAPGIYNEAINFNGMAVRLYSSGGQNVTAIDANGAFHAVQCVSGEDPNTIMDGFTITGGNADGGGMYNHNSSPTVTNCTFTGNSAEYCGGGMYNRGSSPTVTYCTFSDNSAACYGGGMYNRDGSPTVTNCIFNGNSSVYGGGMHNNNSNPTVTNCIFSVNVVTYNYDPIFHSGCGAGMCNWTSSPTVTDCWFSSNSTENLGGGMYNYSSNPTVTNCTFSDNTAGRDYNTSERGGGMYNDNSNPTVTSCAFSGNWADCGGGMYNNHSSPTAASCNFIDNEADIGGGMCNNSGSPKVTDCVFSGNSSEQGGGMYNGGSNPTVTNCTFSDNAVTHHPYSDFTGCGAGMFNWTSSPTVTNCTFSTNLADFDGGGMYSYDSSSLTITNCTFIGNSAEYRGGGMHNWNQSSPTITNCTFAGNSAEYYGGGMHNRNSSPIITDCIFTGNLTSVDGGGIYNSVSDPNVINCGFNNNTVEYSGGGMFNNKSNPTVTNCTFNGNTANDYGGGMDNYSSNPMVNNCMFSSNSAAWGGGVFNWISNPTVTNCTFSGNSASNGGGMYSYDSSSPTLTNCIFWGNMLDQIHDENSTTTVSHSDVEGGWGGTGNINADPLFVDAAAGDFRLSSSGSPCVDAGDNNAPNLPATDLMGKLRVVDGDRDGTATVDMGAYELQALPIHNITQDRWYDTLQVTIDCADNGDQIEVGPGTYYETIDFKGKAVRLYSSGGPEVTTIDGTGHYHVVKCISGEGRNTILEGFTITGGNANGVVIPDSVGGGILCASSSPTIVNCIISDNVAVHGGGIYGAYSNLAIISCKINDNAATVNGGGLYFYWFYPVVINCEIRKNTATHGGGMMSDYSQPTITNSTFSANVATVGGSGALASLADSIANTPYITNCILWGDTQPEIAYDTFPPVVQYCDVQGAVWPLAGNISVNPLFANAAGGNLQLSPGSPCIDTGIIAVDTDVFTVEVQPLPEDDLNGSPRIYPGVVDLGAYEHRDSDGDGITDGFDTPSVHNLTRGTDHFTVQAAINRASGGDEIEVVPGTYPEAVNFKGKGVRLYSSSGPELTTIDGTGHYHVIQCVSGEDPNTILEGFTIIGGHANGPLSPDCDGGGMYNVASSPTVTNCIFKNNQANHGGGMLNVDGRPTVTGCTFQNNTASGGMIGGGGMFNHNSSPLVTSCTFIGNSGEAWGGGGMFNAVESNPTLINCMFSNNSAVGGGGGIYNWNDTMPILINCTFRGNSATEYGGGIFNINSSSPTIINCTFSDNTSTSNGGGIGNLFGGSPTVTNCILWGNTAGAGPQIFDDGTSSAAVTYSDVQGGWSGEGNIDENPLLIDPNGVDDVIGTADDDLRLAYNSPCIDVGSNAGIPAGITTDLDGHRRTIDGDCDHTTVVDMGAYEFNYAYLGDFDYNCQVNLADFAIFSTAWMSVPSDTNWNHICDISSPANQSIDLMDLRAFCQHWLQSTRPK